MPDKSSPRRQGSGLGSDLPLRGIHINVSSDPFQHRIPPHLQRAWQESRLRRYLSAVAARRRLLFIERSSSRLQIGVFAALLLCCACFVLLLHVGFFSGKKYQDWQYEHYGWLDDEVDLLHKLYPDQGRAQVTAILLFDPQDEGAVAAEASESIVPLIEQLCPYDMFSSILIWNNNPKVNFTIQSLELSSTCSLSKINIYNSPSHMGVAGRYLGCSLANTPYCYFQDQAGPRSLRSLYASFLQFPDLVHGESRDPIAYAQARWRWCFFNSDIHMHTCHTLVGYGTFVSKETVSKFVHMVELDPIDIRYSDQYFIVYTNQVPYMIEGATGSFPDEEDMYDREGALMDKKFYPNLTETERHHVHQALVSLYNHLDHRTDLFPEQEKYPSMLEQYAKTACHDDRCLFLTNVNEFPDVRIFNYNVNVDMQVSERIHDGYFNTESQYYKHPFKHAVDGDESTAWKSTQLIKAGDFIGLDLLMPMRIPLRFRFLARHPYSYRRHLSLQISFDGNVWMEIHPAPTMQCDAIDDSSHDAPLLECRFTMTETGYRFIRLQSMRDMDFKYEVHDFSFNAKVRRDVNGKLIDFDLDDESILV